MTKVWKIVLICVLIWGSLLVLLSLIWYRSIFKGHFSFFDDSAEWLQMDKTGHFFASFQVSRWFIQLLIWQKVPKEMAHKVGVWGGILFVSPIELLDGFSEAYGFSWSDLLANCLGSLFLWVQLRWFSTLCFLPKFSFCPSPFAAIRKEMLGTTLFAQFIKDYNGQLYWMSFSPNVLLKKPFFPPWLLFSVGYGVENMLGGHDNEWESKNQHFDFSHLPRYREVFVSLDISLQDYTFSHPVLRFTRLALSCLKFPFPAIGWSTEKGVIVNWIGI